MRQTVLDALEAFDEAAQEHALQVSEGWSGFDTPERAKDEYQRTKNELIRLIHAYVPEA